ncbi:MAG: lytic transglycosylase domain-containing protein [Deltaproteobacteria bacterium]|nr:lytic transglycosylase domain-containing protein [Deltaproteobacteria bacterium]
MNTAALLETSVLNYLIKTMELILSRTDKPDQYAPFPRIPFWGEGSLQPLPVPNNPVTETSSEASANKPKGQEIDEIIQGAADQYGVEPSLIKAVVAVESNGNPRAVSPAGAQGLMQLMPKTATELGVIDPFDPAQNIMAGTRYLSYLLDRYKGNQKLAL